ncbi:MAG TPA: winged helix-turn-helix domain-containing protein [Amycolatopsis sp.]|nr:winged helix-turn-helix domain-containing protein [Amycolatopsis sp.]
MRIELTLHDLAHLGLACAADPLWELASSLRLLGGSGTSGIFHKWRDWARARLPESTRVLEWLYLRGGAVPGFLLPTARGDLASGLAAVGGTGPERIRAELRWLPVDPGLPAWARALPNGDRSALLPLVRAIEDYFQAAVAPHWAAVRTRVDADRELRARALLDGGAVALLASLRPILQWRPRVTTTREDPRTERAGLLLSPSYFALVPELVTGADGPTRLVYPAVRLPGPAHPRRSPGKSLGALLGPTRAAALTIVAADCGTSELARRLGVTASAASKHASVLRAAGLITTHREGTTARHSLTPLGSALLDAAPPVDSGGARPGRRPATRTVAERGQAGD